MTLAFEHSYDTSERMGFRGSSTRTTGTDDMYSIIEFPNGTAEAPYTKRVEAGQVVRLPLTDWFVAANMSRDYDPIGLDKLNTAVRQDLAGNHPRIRTSGIIVKVSIEYTNDDPTTRKSMPFRNEVRAYIRLRPEYGTWTGTGVETTWVQYPTLNRDIPQEFHLVEKWKQVYA